jgi:predicted nucleic acid-binding protein
LGKLIEAISGKLVAIDTAPFIYYIEEDPTYASIVDVLFDAVDRNVCRGVTSVLTLQEVLVQPLRLGRPDLAVKYREILKNSRNILLLDISPAIAERAAGLRAKYRWLRAPDAFQIATGLGSGAQLVFTHDSKWKSVKEIPVLTFEELS